MKILDEMEKEFDMMAETNEFWGIPYDKTTDRLLKSFIRQHLTRLVEQMDKERYWYFCVGCPEGHSSFWKTVIESPQWKVWQTQQIKNPTYDMSEVEECGWISPKHFQEFMKFTIERIMEEIMPEEKIRRGTERDALHCNGFNSCREQVISNFKRLI